MVFARDFRKYADDSNEFNENEQKPDIDMEENHYGPKPPNDQKIFDLLEQYEVDAFDNFAYDDGFFLEIDALSNPIEADSSGFSMFDVYLTYLDVDDGNLRQMAFDSSEMIGNENSLSNLTPLDQEPVNGGAKKMSISNKQLAKAYGDSGASSSNNNPEVTEFE